MKGNYKHTINHKSISNEIFLFDEQIICFVLASELIINYDNFFPGYLICSIIYVVFDYYNSI